MAGRIRQRWDELRGRGARALIPYVTPDFPVTGSTVDLVIALEQAGASFVEIGVPFSDPLADGPVIQHASQVALQNGATPARVFEIVSQIRTRSSIPIILMGYVNPIIRTGPGAFFAEAAAAGADGIIIPDLPAEEAEEIHAEATGHGLSMVYLIAPTSDADRIRQLDDLSTDFSYCVSITGVTGASSRFASGDAVETFLSRVSGIARKPYVVGFGIASAADVRRVWKAADGAVVGSQLLREIGDATTGADVVARGRKFFEGLLHSVPEGKGAA